MRERESYFDFFSWSCARLSFFLKELFEDLLGIWNELFFALRKNDCELYIILILDFFSAGVDKKKYVILLDKESSRRRRRRQKIYLHGLYGLASQEKWEKERGQIYIV